MHYPHGPGLAGHRGPKGKGIATPRTGDRPRLPRVFHDEARLLDGKDRRSPAPPVTRLPPILLRSPFTGPPVGRPLFGPGRPRGPAAVLGASLLAGAPRRRRRLGIHRRVDHEHKSAAVVDTTLYVVRRFVRGRFARFLVAHRSRHLRLLRSPLDGGRLASLDPALRPPIIRVEADRHQPPRMRRPIAETNVARAQHRNVRSYPKQL